jgi:hypothetical protein
MKQSNKNILEILFAFLLFAGTSLTSAFVQHQTTAHQGLGWDGRFYYSVAAQIAQGKTPHEASPFIYRVGTPTLAALLSPHNVMRGFLIANIIAAGVLAVLMIIWLRLFIESWMVRLLLLALYLIEWHAPARFVYFYPDTADPWAMVFCLSGLICIQKIRTKFSAGLLALLCLICFVGLSFREFVGLVGVAAVFTPNVLSFKEGFRLRKPSLLMLLPLVCVFLGIAVAHSLVVSSGGWLGYSFLRTAGHYWYYQPLVMYLHGWLIAYGPIFFLLIYGWPEVRRFLWEHQYQLVYLAGVTGLSWIGGDDVERYVFWAMPVVYVLCGKVIEEKSAVLRSAFLITFLACTQAISERMFWRIPDEWGGDSPSWVLLTPIKHVSYLNLYTHFGPGASLGLSFLEYSFVGMILVAWLYYRQSRLRRVHDTGALETSQA